MSGSGINIGTAFLQIVPSFQGSRQEAERTGEEMGQRAAQQFSDRFSRDAQGRLRDERGRYAREGSDIGDSMGEGMQGPMGQHGEQGGESFLGGLKGKALAGIAGVAVAVGAAFMDAYNEALDVRKSEVKLQGNLGLTPDQASSLGKTAGQLYAQGYGESIGELTSTVGEVFSSIKGLDATDSAGLQKLTGQAISFSQAFDTDVSESIQSVGTLMNSGLAKDAQNAFDLITRASQKVPAALRGNVLDASDEYSQFFRTLGFSGEEAFDTLVKGAEKGEFGIDKTGDAIKEFTIRSTDMSASSVAAYQAIGLNADEMSNAILSGGDTAHDAFVKIVDGVENIQDPTARANTAISLFGTQMEDMNVADVPQFLEGLKGMSGNMDDAAGSASDMDAAMGSTSSSIDLFWRGLKTKLVDFMTDKVLPAITVFTQWLGEKLGPVIEVVAQWVGDTLVPAVQELSVWLGEHLGPVVEKAGVFFTETLVPGIQKAVEWFSEYLLPIVQRVGEFFGETFSNIFQILGGVIDFIAGIFTGDWSRVWEGVKEIFGGIWDQIKNIFSTLWDVMVSFFTNIGPQLWGIVTSLAGQLVEWGGQFLGWIWQGIQDLWNGTIWPWFQALPGMAWDGIQAAAGWLFDRGAEFLSWVWNGITSFFSGTLGPWFASLPQKAWDALLGFVGAAGGWMADRGSEFIGWVTQGIKDGASDLWNWFIGLPAKAWEILVALKDGVIKIGKDFASWIVDGIKSAAQAVADAVTSLFSVKLNEDGTGYIASGIGDPGVVTGGSAYGGVIPGRDPGRRDNVLGRLPSGVGWGLRSEESVFVPEFTRAIGGAPTVHAWNRAAEQGRLGDYLPGFARGGVVEDAKALGKQASEGIAAGIKNSDVTGLFGRIVKDVLDSATAAIASMSTGGVDPDTARGKFIAAMLSKQGTSYVWGAAGPDVFDCSGLVSWALEQAGVGKGRLTAEGFNSSFPKGAEIPGNLVTFDTGRLPGQAGHIGAIVDATRGLMMHTDGAGPARVSDYRSRDGGPLNIVDAIGDGGAARIAATFTGILSGIKGMISTQLNNAIGPSGETPGGTGVERWRGIVDQALTMTGQPTSLDGYVLHQMDTESSGNPQAENRYDINFQRGDSSKGLMQVIGSTFRAYALPGFNTNIWDPLSNIIASIRYVLARYGSIPAGMQGHAYDSGGLFPGGSIGFNFLAQPEAVLTPPETEAYQRVAAALASGDLGGPSAPMLHVERMEILRGTPEDIVDEMLWRVA